MRYPGREIAAAFIRKAPGLLTLEPGTRWPQIDERIAPAENEPVMPKLFASGFFVGYLVYDMTHYYLHHFKPRTRFGKLMRELHMRHHFQDDTRGFGISAPFWDYVFGTPLKRGR